MRDCVVNITVTYHVPLSVYKGTDYDDIVEEALDNLDSDYIDEYYAEVEW